MKSVRSFAWVPLLGSIGKPLAEASCASPDYQRYVANAVCTNHFWQGSSATSCEAQCNANPRCSFFTVWHDGHCELFDQCLGTRYANADTFWKTDAKMVVTIGPNPAPSNVTTKCVPMPFGAEGAASCVANAGLSGNRVNADGKDAQDAFSITTRGSQVCATRTDNVKTWDMNLQIACCRSQAAAPFEVKLRIESGVCATRQGSFLAMTYKVAGYTSSGAPFYRGGDTDVYLFWDGHRDHGCVPGWILGYGPPNITRPSNLLDGDNCPFIIYQESEQTSLPPLGTAEWMTKCNSSDWQYVSNLLSLTAESACPARCGTCAECVSWQGECGSGDDYCVAGTDCSLCASVSTKDAQQPDLHTLLYVCVTVVVSSALLAVGMAVCCRRRPKAEPELGGEWDPEQGARPGSSGVLRRLGRGSASRREQGQRGGAWEQLKAKWGFIARFENDYSVDQKEALTEYLSDPGKWSISWNGLKRLEDQAKELFGDAYPSKSMLDVVQELVKPACAQHGAPIALVMNDWVPTTVEGFVTHCWAETFSDFMGSLTQAYGARLTKPNLFICAFTIFQGTPDDISRALGGEIREAPFVQCLAVSSHITVVRNSIVDIYERGWCLIEFIYAKKFGLYPQHVNVTGPNTFHGSSISVMDAKASVKSDREKILKAILKEGSAEEMDQQISSIRAYFE